MHTYTAMVLVTDAILNRLPRPLATLLRRHNELVKFALVGGTTFIIDTAIFLGLKSTVLESRPLTAKVVSTTIATVISYILSRQWSFRTRGGRSNHHEAMLFFLISVIGIGVTVAPLSVSRYVLHLRTPEVSRFTQEVADLVSAQIVGTLLAMVFRFWAFRRFVFPHANARPRGDRRAPSGETVSGAERRPAAEGDLDAVDLDAAELLGDPWPVPDSGRLRTEREDPQRVDPDRGSARDLLDSDTEDPLSTRS